MNLRKSLVSCSVLIAVVVFSARSSACSVCFGDPDSAMAKGATAGVLFMVGVIGFVLCGIAGLGLTWVHRSRRLAGGVESVG